jgi:hypothetical protein
LRSHRGILDDDLYRRGESFQQRESVEAVWLLAVHELKWLYRNPIATLLDPAPINKPRPASLFGETSLYDLYHRALPRLSSVTESIGLPPQPIKAGDMSSVYKFHVREWLVPPVVLPVFFVLLIAAAALIQW